MAGGIYIPPAMSVLWHGRVSGRVGKWAFPVTDIFKDVNFFQSFFKKASPKTFMIFQMPPGRGFRVGTGRRWINIHEIYGKIRQIGITFCGLRGTPYLTRRFNHMADRYRSGHRTC
ncbi:hypothetical protein [Novacetimonas pomaceti]|uniref:hypothetical protein n=1 Tax=Novacetimonas pomaceti TaxID=2021998 RepID=UPI001C2D76BE|nr:hypothetical protein [Novacetimonas pomaceti]MBV1835183.1 hypothetical protein [Novacetimonas pomaceti]